MYLSTYLRACMISKTHRPGVLFIEAHVNFPCRIICIVATFPSFVRFHRCKNFETSCNDWETKQKRYLENVSCWEKRWAVPLWVRSPWRTSGYFEDRERGAEYVGVTSINFCGAVEDHIWPYDVHLPWAGSTEGGEELELVKADCNQRVGKSGWREQRCRYCKVYVHEGPVAGVHGEP